MQIQRLETLQYHNPPSGGSSDLIIVILSQDLEQLVEEHWQESDDHWDPLHAEKTLEMDEKDEWRRTRRGRRVERWKGQVRRRQRRGEKYIKKEKAGQMQFGKCRIAQQKHCFSSLSQLLKMDSGLSLTFRQLRKLEVGGSERSSSLFWHCWKNRFKCGSWHKEQGPSKWKVRIWWRT